MSGFGFLFNIFGSAKITLNTYINFGIMTDFGITRTETVETIIQGISTKNTDSPKFLGISITPFLGIMFNF
jgi:hypothetical protein